MKHILDKYIIFSMEAKRLMQNRKQIWTMFLVPVLMVLTLLWGVALLETKEQYGRIDVYGANMYSDMLLEKFSEYEVVLSEEKFVVESFRLDNEKNNVAINVLQNEIQIIYDSAMVTNVQFLDVAKRMADSILTLKASESTYVNYWQGIDVIQSVDIGQSCDYLKNVLLPLISLVFVIILMLTNMSISNLAIEMYAGEREKGSFDLLLLSGTRLKTIVLEKYIFLTLNTFLLLIVQGTALFLGLRYFQPELYSIVNFPEISKLKWFITLTVCFLAMAMFISALFIGIASSFEKKKQATAYIGIIQIFMAMFTYIPNVLGEEMLNYLPISNLTGVMGAAMNGETTIGYLGGSLGISMLVTIISLNYSECVLERDRKK